MPPTGVTPPANDDGAPRARTAAEVLKKDRDRKIEENGGICDELEKQRDKAVAELAEFRENYIRLQHERDDLAMRVRRLEPK